MKQVLRLAVCLSVAFCALPRPAGAESNPYGAIVERNVFDLKPPPPPPGANAATNTPPPNVRLTGITTILGPKRALFMVKDADSPGKQANKEQSVILGEGEREGVLEVLEINEKTGTVKIRNDGNFSVLAFENTKLPSAPAGGPGAGPGGMPKLPSFVPPGAPGAPGFPRPGGYGANPAYGGMANPAGGLSSIPTRTVRTQDDQPPLTPEQQMVMMEAQREANRNNPMFPPLPSTPLTPLLQQGQGQDPGTADPYQNMPPIVRKHFLNAPPVPPPMPGQ